jgi:hypothetical protein
MKKGMITDKIIHTIKKEGNAYLITFKIDSAVILDKFDTITHTHTEYMTRFEDFIDEMNKSNVDIFSSRGYDKYEGDYVLRHFMVYSKSITDNTVHNCLHRMLKFIDDNDNG